MNNDLYLNGRKLPVMEEFYSLQGEGFNTGKPAFFLRIGGCDIGCAWCDSKLSWSADHYPLADVDEIVGRIRSYPAKALVVTGGEPGLYPMDYLCDKVRESGILTYLETSGAYPLSGSWDWICLSPKIQNPPHPANYEKANELKVIIESPGDFHWAEENARRVNSSCHLFLQPEWSRRNRILEDVIAYICNNPKWRLSLQSHKYIGIP